MIIWRQKSRDTRFRRYASILIYTLCGFNEVLHTLNTHVRSPWCQARLLDVKWYYGSCRCWDSCIKKLSPYFTMAYIRNSYCNWVHLLQINLIQIKEQGLNCSLDTKSPCYFGIRKRSKNKYKWYKWNGPLLLNGNYVLQETWQILFLPNESYYNY